jgi:hypothetical protein
LRPLTWWAPENGGIFKTRINHYNRAVNYPVHVN